MSHVVDAGGKYQSQSFEDSQAFPSFAASPGVRDGTHQVLAQIVYVIDWAYSTSFLPGFVSHSFNYLFVFNGRRLGMQMIFHVPPLVMLWVLPPSKNCFTKCI